MEDAFGPGLAKLEVKFASQYEFTKLFVTAWKSSTLPSGHLSKFTDLIFVM